MNYIKTQVEGNYNIFPSYLNRHNTLFGGQLLYWVDEIMGLVIRKYTDIPFVTASIDNYQFIKPVPKEDMVTIKSYISGIGTKSLEIFVELSSFNHTNRETKLIGLCFATFCIRKDFDFNNNTLEQVTYKNELPLLVSSGYNSRKKGDFSYRNFAKQYEEIFNNLEGIK